MYPFSNDRVNLKPVCLLLGLCHAGSAAALGLGELNVRSYLGQPLHATVKIIDAGATTAVDCFSLAPSEDSSIPPLRAQLSLEQAGSQTLLHIRTAQPVYDPIAQFVLVSDCEARLQRDYAILLDPPAAVAPPVQTEAEAALATAPPAPRSTPHPTTSRQRTGQVTSPPLSKQRLPARRTPAVAEAAPRLLLSGRRLVNVADAAFFLKLDTNLPDLARPFPEGLSATELSDENTALAHKLAYLEAQLAALQQRNAELEAKRQTASPTPIAVKPPVADQPAQWPLYLLAVGLLTGAGTLVAWLRRRSRSPSHPTIDELENAGVPTHTATLLETDPDMVDPWAQPMPEEAGMLAAPQRMPEIAAPLPIETTEIKDDILDQAEVYMAHGHGDLAVHLLQEYLRNAPDESPVPWLLLLDLLHREGNTDDYAAACIECRRHFNINLSGHPVSQDSDTSQGLEAYPHLTEHLTKVWNTPASDAFFQDLIYDNRGGSREGFEPGAYRDILLLRAIAQDVLPLAA